MSRCRFLVNFVLLIFGSGQFLLPSADGCEYVPAPENGIAQQTESGSIITFTCSDGYSLSGSETITCTENGWSGAAPKCISDQTSLPRGDTTCLTSPPSVTNSVYGIQLKQHDNGDEYYVVTYRCYQGYLLQSGETTQICSEGRWIWPSGGPLVCTPTCSAPSFSCEYSCVDEPTGAVCTCGEGYSLVSGHYCYNINECLTDGICGHGVCRDYPGSYLCYCSTGYKLVDGKCEDENECEQRNPCQNGECVNTIGSYQCSCNEGYRAISNKYCDDINECYENPGLCEHGRCYNDFPGYICGSCDYGFKTSADRRSCEDVNECESEDNQCKHTCINTVGSYSCGCEDGYVLSNNRFTCVDVDECRNGQNACPSGGVCTNTEGSYTCSVCQPGRILENGICKDINECRQDLGYGYGYGPCEGWCANAPGSYTCSCPQSRTQAGGKWIGYELAEDGHRCIQEVCSTSACAHNCIPTRGSSYRCSCNAGYRLDSNGYDCIDINECDSPEAHDCPQACVNTEGSYKCRCPNGHVTTPSGGCEACRPDSYYNLRTNRCFECPANSGTGGKTARTTIRHCSCNDGYESTSSKLVCNDIDECADNGFGCSYQCVNTPGSAYCVCEPGYELDENLKTCVDKDECSIKNGGCQHVCTDFVGGFNCSCKKGYIQDPNDKYRCLDIDECQENNGGCEINCRNYEGGYYCACSETSLINDDGVSCDAIVCSPLVVPHNGRLSPKKRCTGIEDGYALIVGTVCEYSCDTGYELTELPTRTCLNTGRWSGETPSCRPLTCPPLPPIEHGEVIPASCLVNPQVFRARCAYTCEPGYVIDGNQFSKCKGVEGWTSATPKCVRDILPEISCNNSITVELAEGESATTVDIPEPVHNLDYLERSKPADTQFGPGSYYVEFVARSQSHDVSISCDVRVTVLDKEPPKIKNCPRNFVVETEDQYPEVIWVEPTITDNVMVTKNSTSISPNGRFTWGTYHVTYEARDAANNIAICKFQIKIEPKDCEPAVGPLNGNSNCIHWLFGLICNPSCNDGFEFFDKPTIHVCGADSEWKPSRRIGDCTAFTLHKENQADCPLGTVVRDKRGMGCLTCPRGMFGEMRNGRSVCTECPIGTYQNATGMTFCELCPLKLSTQQEGAINEAECVEIELQVETTDTTLAVTEIAEEEIFPPEESSSSIIGGSDSTS